jgi:hypothetical protein
MADKQTCKVGVTLPPRNIGNRSLKIYYFGAVIICTITPARNNKIILPGMDLIT